MVRSRLKNLPARRLLRSLFLLLLLCGPVLATEAIAPQREISLVGSEEAIPEWRSLWGDAREMARNEDYVEAVRLYGQLFKLKDNIEELNWEYCKVLLKNGDAAAAGRILAGLLEQNPSRNDYLLAAGLLAEQGGDAARAVHYFGKVFEKNPVGADADTALAGLVRGLRDQGKRTQALPLLEGLSQRHPEDRALLYTLALDSRDHGRADRARQLFARLLDYPEVEDRLIFQAAELFDVPGHEQRRQALWEEYLRRHPEYLPFRVRLAAAYRQQGEFEAALRQYQFLADNVIDTRPFLLLAGEISQDNLGRPDKALLFYEKIRRENPGDKEVVERIEAIQLSLADDLLVIVENGGGAQLWRDLVEIAPNRLAIFLEIAELLEGKGRVDELVEILTIIHQHYPADDQITLRIARQYAEAGDHGQALHFFDLAGKAARNQEYHLHRAKSELALGLELAVLDSFAKALAFTPDDIQLRRSCIELAGSLGLVERAAGYFAEAFKAGPGENAELLYFSYLQQLSRNSLFSRHATVLRTALDHFAGNGEVVARLKLHQAKTLRREGKRRSAEQVLRVLLNEGILVDEVLFDLADNALTDRNWAAAGAWLPALARRHGLADLGSITFRQPDLLLLRLKEERLAGKPETALLLLSGVKVGDQPGDLPAWVQTRLAKEICHVQYAAANYPAAWQSCREALELPGFDPEVLQLQSLVAEKIAGQGDVNNRMLTVAGKPILSRQLAMAEIEIAQLDFPAAEKRLNVVLNVTRQSVAATAALAEIATAQGRFADAVNSLEQLQERFPEEQFFEKKLIDIEMRQGRYDRALTLLRQRLGADSIEQMMEILDPSEETDTLLTLARVLWGNRDQKKALWVYQRLLTPSVADLLREDFEERQVNERAVALEKSFWYSLAFLLSAQPDRVADLMEPSFLLDNLGSETGAVVSGHFARFSWQDLIGNEFQARKAIAERHFFYAERSYQKLLEKEDAIDAMSDLATIYSRIGKYRKEAQIYEAMQSSGQVSPDIAESMARSNLQLSPQNVFAGEFQRKEGRGGLVDLLKTTAETAFWVAPDLEKELRFRYANSRYRSIDGDATAGSNLVAGMATFDFGRHYELTLTGGAEKFNGKSDTVFTSEALLRGQVDDFASGYVLIGQRLVEDSVATVQEQITYSQIKTGLDLETVIGATFGGDIAHRSYSDGNSQNRFHGYSSYSVFGEAQRLEFRYDFDYFISSNEYTKRSAINPGEAEPTETRYWSPDNFTEHRLGINFRHDFLGYREDKKSGISFYSLSNTIGLEDNQTVAYTGLFHFSLEISPHLLVKGDFTFSASDEYEEKAVVLGLHYRW